MNTVLSRSGFVLLAGIGIGLILNEMTVLGILVGSSAVGLWLADFRLEDGELGRRLVAKGSPALLLLPLLLGAGKIYMAAASTVFSGPVDPVSACVLEDERPARPLVKLLEPRP